jgi:hypothetical protein
MTTIRIAVAVLLIAGACTGRDIDMVEVEPDDNDHGHAALLAAVEAHTKRPVTPEAFREFALEIRGIAPRFNEEISEFAELYLAFAALPVMQSLVDLPRDEQLDRLALTVFPTAFGLEPEPGETAYDYLLRLCGEAQPLECKEYAPQGWPVVLVAKARRKLKHRAQEALSGCNICGNEDTYTGILEEFGETVAKEDAYAALHEDDYLPEKWPLAGPAAEPWSDAHVFALAGGDATLDAEPLPTGRWVKPLAAARDGDTVLGVHLRPTAKVRELRVIAGDASKAGYRELALQVREKSYPFERKQYRLQLTGRATRVDVRDIDTIQILARALDPMAARKTPARL